MATRTTSFKYSHTVGRYALRGPGFLNPVDMLLTSGRLLYVLSRGHSEMEDQLFQKRVTVCSVEGEFLNEFGTGGNRDGQLMWPASIAAGQDENLYVSDEYLQRITILDQAGHFLAKWGRKGDQDGEFDRPAGLAFDRDGYLLVVDGLNHRVQRYTREGKFLDCWGRYGSNDGEFNLPWGITVDHAGDIYVADWRNDRIQKFDADGRFIAGFGSPGQGHAQFRRPSGVAVDRDGHILVADRGNERVQLLGPDGRFIAEFHGESGWSKLAQEWFDIANKDLLAEWQKADLEPELEPVPSDPLSYKSGSVIKLFWGPTAIKVDEQGAFYVLESCRHRVQVYRRDDGNR